MKSYRILSAALALCLLLGLTACGKKGETASSGDAVSSQASDSSSAAGEPFALYNTANNDYAAMRMLCPLAGAKPVDI